MNKNILVIIGLLLVAMVAVGNATTKRVALDNQNLTGSTTIIVNASDAGAQLFYNTTGAINNTTIQGSDSIIVNDVVAGVQLFLNSTDDYGALVNGVNELETFRGALLNTTGTQSVPNATITNVVFASEIYDTNDFHSTIVNTSRITIPPSLDGRYARFSGYVVFATSSTGNRSLLLYKNGTHYAELIGAGESSPGGEVSLDFTTSPLVVNSGDYYDLRAYQSSGGALNIITTGGLGTAVNASFSIEIVK